MAQVTFIVHTIHLPQSVGGEVSGTDIGYTTTYDPHKVILFVILGVVTGKIRSTRFPIRSLDFSICPKRSEGTHSMKFI